MISFIIDQLKEFEWLRPRKPRMNKNKMNARDLDEDWGDIDYDDEREWTKYLHLRSVFKSYDHQYRKICIDFIPNLIYSVESFVEVLVRSKVSQYVDFRGMDK